jgi:GTP diphosphokinase / guanosine-3',5'-bis(diphosphate) 3'-diphosphatase
MKKLKKIEKLILDKVPDIYDKEVSTAMNYAKKIYKGQVRLSGETVYEHALKVAKQAANINMDTVSIIASLFHQALYDDRNYKQFKVYIRENFGEEVFQLTTDLYIINVATKTQNIYTNRTVVNFLTFGLSDQRVGLIKLCDVIENARSIEFLSPASQKRFLTKLLKIYSHVAVFYNLYDFKIELETTALRILKPGTFEAIAKEIDKRQITDNTVNEIIDYFHKMLHIGDTEAYIYGRHKSPYSIYRKQFKYFDEGKSAKFSQIRDYYAFTLIVKDIDEAYAVSEIIKTFTKIDYDEFEDYILKPKKNDYRAIHIITKLEDGFNTEVEIQIKTEEMHYHSTYGPASHIAYKYSDKREADSSDEFSWIENLHRSIKEHTNLREKKRSIPINNYSKTEDVFVRTPRGRIYQLPKDSTPIEFARAVHSKFVKVATSARINGKASKLDTKLKSGDVVEIILDRNRLRALQT